MTEHKTKDGFPGNAPYTHAALARKETRADRSASPGLWESRMSEAVTVIVWSLYLWPGAAPNYDIERRPILEESTKLVGEYETQARCEEERNKQVDVARCIPHKIERK